MQLAGLSTGPLARKRIFPAVTDWYTPVTFHFFYINIDVIHQAVFFINTDIVLQGWEGESVLMFYLSQSTRLLPQWYPAVDNILMSKKMTHDKECWLYIVKQEIINKGCVLAKLVSENLCMWQKFVNFYFKDLKNFHINSLIFQYKFWYSWHYKNSVNFCW